MKFLQILRLFFDWLSEAVNLLMAGVALGAGIAAGFWALTAWLVK